MNYLGVNICDAFFTKLIKDALGFDLTDDVVDEPRVPGQERIIHTQLHFASMRFKSL